MNVLRVNPQKRRAVWLLIVCLASANTARAADKLVALYSAHAVPYSMPWVAEELGLLKKYDIDLEFVYIPSSSAATAALLGGNHYVVSQADNARHRLLVPRRQLRGNRFRFANSAAPAADYFFCHQ